MRFEIHPAGFQIGDATAPGPNGPIPLKQIQVVDTSGITVALSFGLEDWEAFRRYVADPVGETERQQARAKLLLAQPGQPLVPRGGKH